jgi:hypothetical protein
MTHALKTIAAWTGITLFWLGFLVALGSGILTIVKALF